MISSLIPAKQKMPSKRRNKYSVDTKNIAVIYQRIWFTNIKMKIIKHRICINVKYSTIVFKFYLRHLLRNLILKNVSKIVRPWLFFRNKISTIKNNLYFKVSKPVSLQKQGRTQKKNYWTDLSLMQNKISWIKHVISLHSIPNL